MSGFTFDLSQLTNFTQRLGKSGSVGQDRELVNEFNAVVDEVYITARGMMNAGINLTDDYLRSKMDVVHATPGRGLIAEITAIGGPNDQTPLSRYMVGQASKPAPKARGSAARGVPAGRKAAGVEVAVTRGGNVTLVNAFTMPLRRGGQAGGNGLGIFLRTRYGIVRHRYGPAPYQLFRVAAGRLEDTVGDTLAERLSPFAAAALEKALA